MNLHQSAIEKSKSFSPGKLALLEQRLRGRAVAIDDPADQAPSKLLKAPQDWYAPYALRGFQSERLAHLSGSANSFRLLMETWRGELDVERFRSAWKTLYRHYDAMRSAIVEGQHVIAAPDTSYDISFEDLRGLTPSAAKAHEKAMRSRFNALGHGCGIHAVEVAVLQTKDDSFTCYFSFDLLVMDLPSAEFLALRCRRAYEGVFESEHRPHFSIRDYRITEDAYLKSADGRAALGYWERRISSIDRRLRASDVFDVLGEEPTYDYICDTVAQPQWTSAKQIAKSFEVSELSAVQTLFVDFLALRSNCTNFGIESRFFQRLPLDRDIYELLGPFTIGHILHHSPAAPQRFVDRVRAAQQQAQKDAVHSFVDAATHWQKDESNAQRGGKIVFTNTCLRFDEFVQNSSVPPLRWLGDFKTTLQFLPDTALEYVLVENDWALENHWFINNRNITSSSAHELYGTFFKTLSALCVEPSLWEAECVFAAAEDYLRGANQ